MINFSRTGTRAGVIKEIEALAPTAPATEDPQLQAVKDFLVAEVNSLPAEFNGVRVDANGDAQKAGRTMQVNIIGQKLAL